MDVRLLMRKKDEALVRAQNILDVGINESRDLNVKEKASYESERREANRLDGQIKEAQDIENLRAGIPPNQPEPGMPDGDPMPGMSIGHQRNDQKIRLVDTKTGREVRTFLPGEDWNENRTYNLPDGIKPEELSLTRIVRGLVNNDWKGAEAEQRTMGESIGGLGGWLLPFPIASMIIQAARNKLRVIGAGALTIQMDGPELVLAKVSQEPEASWVPENQKSSIQRYEFHTSDFES